jgi:hydrogenase/urease accessory protein HupE
VLCQLSYAPLRFVSTSVPGHLSKLSRVKVPSQRPAMGALFLILCLVFAGIAVAAFAANAWVIAFAATVLGLWLLTMAGRALLVGRLRRE